MGTHKDVLLVTPLPHTDHRQQEGSKILNYPKVLGKQTTKLRSQTPPVLSVRERQVEPHYCDIKGRQQTTLDYWTRHKTGRNQALLALGLVA